MCNLTDEQIRQMYIDQRKDVESKFPGDQLRLNLADLNLMRNRGQIIEARELWHETIRMAREYKQIGVEIEAILAADVVRLSKVFPRPRKKILADLSVSLYPVEEQTDSDLFALLKYLQFKFRICLPHYVDDCPPKPPIKQSNMINEVIDELSERGYATETIGVERDMLIKRFYTELLWQRWNPLQGIPRKWIKRIIHDPLQQVEEEYFRQRHTKALIMDPCTLAKAYEFHGRYLWKKHKRDDALREFEKAVLVWKTHGLLRMALSLYEDIGEAFDERIWDPVARRKQTSFSNRMWALEYIRKALRLARKLEKPRFRRLTIHRLTLKILTILQEKDMKQQQKNLVDRYELSLFRQMKPHETFILQNPRIFSRKTRNEYITNLRLTENLVDLYMVLGRYDECVSWARNGISMVHKILANDNFRLVDQWHWHSGFIRTARKVFKHLGLAKENTMCNEILELIHMEERTLRERLQRHLKEEYTLHQYQDS